MVDITLRLEGRSLHLVRRAGDGAFCRNHAAHRLVAMGPFVRAEVERAAQGNAAVQADLREVVAALLPMPIGTHVIDSEVFKHVGWLLETGRLVLLECIEARRELPDAPRASFKRDQGRGQPVPLEDPKTWIAIELLEEKTRKPVPNIRYVVKGPSGTFEGALDAKGQARIGNLDPGTYDVSFVDIDGREWKPA